MSDIRKEKYPYSEANEAAYAALKRGNFFRDLAQQIGRSRDRLESGGYRAVDQLIDAEIYAHEQSILGYVAWLKACKE
jgi:hypothetical protein